jgi:hypothetical protein
MRLKKLEEMIEQNNKTLEDVKFFVDFLNNLCKDYAGQFHGYTNEMFLKVSFPNEVSY